MWGAIGMLVLSVGGFSLLRLCIVTVQGKSLPGWREALIALACLSIVLMGFTWGNVFTESRATKWVERELADLHGENISITAWENLAQLDRTSLHQVHYEYGGETRHAVTVMSKLPALPLYRGEFVLDGEASAGFSFDLNTYLFRQPRFLYEPDELTIVSTQVKTIDYLAVAAILCSGAYGIVKLLRNQERG